MKDWSLVLSGLVAVSVNAGTIVLHNGGATYTTGDVLDEVTEAGITTNVVEMPELSITARSGGAGQKINTTSSSLGITTFGSGDDTDRLEFGETMILSFDKTVEITELDMIGFKSNSTFVIDIEGIGPFTVTYDDLPNKSAQYFPTSIVVTADTEISLYAGNTNSVIGLQFIDLNVLGSNGEFHLSLTASNDWITIDADFEGTPTTNYVLQSSTNLTSNVWNSVTGTFNANTNWTFSATNRLEFFRIIEQ